MLLPIPPPAPTPSPGYPSHPPPTTNDPDHPLRHISLLLGRRGHTTRSLAQVHALLIKTSLIHHPRSTRLLLLPLSRVSPSHSLRLLLHPPAHLLPPRDPFSFTFLLRSCARLRALSEALQLHALLLKLPSASSTHSLNSLLHFYSSLPSPPSTLRRVFSSIPHPDVFSWNCLLHGLASAGDLPGARQVFDEMPIRDSVSWTTMLVAYLDAGSLADARTLFNSMPEKNNPVTWTAMIGGFARQGLHREALELFAEMTARGDVEVDAVALTTALSACANLGTLDQGRWIHVLVGRRGVRIDALLATALVDMYAKCGRIDDALDLFGSIGKRKVFLWNAMLGGLAMHSRGREALELYEKMLQSGVTPNEITFICVLSACSHMGLVDKGLQIFSSIERDHNLTPTVEHYCCLVDLLGRMGLLDCAKEVVDNMPFEPDGDTLRALLAACRMHGNMEMGEEVGRMLLKRQPVEHENYVLLSNVLAGGRRWEDVAKMRKGMKVRGVRKVPGWSSIELDGILHTFSSGNTGHPQSEEIYRVLDEITAHISLRDTDDELWAS